MEICRILSINKLNILDLCAKKNKGMLKIIKL